MTTHKTRKILLAAAGVGALGLVAGLAACGETGPLQQPPPLFGRAAKQEYYAQRSDQARAAAARSQSQQNEVGSAEAAANTVDNDQPLTTRDIQDPDSKLTTPRNAPVPGEPNPLGATVSTTPPN